MAKKKKEDKYIVWRVISIIAFISLLIFSLYNVNLRGVFVFIIAVVGLFISLPIFNKIIEKRFNHILPTPLKAIALIVLFCVGWGLITGSDVSYIPEYTPEDTTQTPKPEVETPKKVNIPQKEYAPEDLVTILNKFVKSDSLTDLQKEELWESYKGKYVKGSAYVYSVDKKMFGQLVVLADNSPRGQYDFSSDYSITFQKSEKEKLLEVSKGQKITFEGKLKDYSGFMMGYLYIGDAVLIS